MDTGYWILDTKWILDTEYWYRRNVCTYIDYLQIQDLAAYRPGSCDNYHRDALTAASFNAPTIAAAPTPKPKIPTTTLWMNRLDNTLIEQHIHRLVDRLAPVVSVERPKDKHGKLRSYAFVTLLSQHADMAIKHLNGKWVNEWTCL